MLRYRPDGCLMMKHAKGCVTGVGQRMGRGHGNGVEGLHERSGSITAPRPPVPSPLIARRPGTRPTSRGPLPGKGHQQFRADCKNPLRSVPRHPAGATCPPIDWSPSERSGATRLCIRCACAAAAHPTSRFKTAKPSSHPLRRKVDQVLPTPRTGFGCSAQCGVQATTVISEARHSNRASPRRKPHRR